MSSSDNYYTAGSPAPPPPPSKSQSFSSPPPPPPEPAGHEYSRSGTPQTLPQQQQYGQGPAPPVPPYGAQSPVAYQPPPQPAPRSSYTQSPPPPLPPQQVHSPPPIPAQQPIQQQQQYQPVPTSSPPQQAPPFPLPPSLTTHTTADLTHLLSTPALLTALAQQHPSYAPSLQPLHSSIAQNQTLATAVLALESQVRSLRDQTAQMLLTHTSLQTQWRRKQGEVDDALSPWGPRAMNQRLVAGIGEQEAVLRAVVESFLEGGGGEGDGFYGDAGGKATEKEVTDWIRRVREGTVVLEKRREMRARWDEGRVGGWR